jgi:hypothetical protein
MRDLHLRGEMGGQEGVPQQGQVCLILKEVWKLGRHNHSDLKLNKQTQHQIPK